VHALPALIASVTAVLIAPSILRALTEGGHVRTNYRERELPVPFGLLTVASALLALVPLELLARLSTAEVFYPRFGMVALYTLGVSLLGLIDDMFTDASRGWRGHSRQTLSGSFSTGALKAAGSLGLALYVMSTENLSTGRYLLATAVLVLATNVFNLIDLRPGRSIKALILLGAALSIATANTSALWTLGLFAGPALIAGLYDLRERVMLGDTGANLIGALAGLWIVFTLSGVGQAVALGLLLGITIYGEFRSISEFVQRTPGFRQLDSWGRPS
jgi:UDP-GlcNAc:undecaprenyl-phosphate/decaprenyl-phosphate GlcNAc-1-phosphate transferase